MVSFAVLHSDYTTGLSYLMKYPSNIDVLSIIRHSLHMYAPDKYGRPPDIFTVQAKQQQYSGRDGSHSNAKSATLPRKTTQNVNSHQKRINDDSPRHSARNYRSHDSNKLGYSSEVFREHVNSLQNSSAKATMRVVNPPQLNKEPGIVDGYLENVCIFI